MMNSGTATQSSSYVDWDLAVSLGSRFAGDGPVSDRKETAAVVAELRAGADRSTGLVRDFTGLVAAERTAPVLVVDRAGWIRANADGFARLVDPVLEKLATQTASGEPREGDPSPSPPSQSGSPPQPGQTSVSRAGRAIGSKVTGAQLGAMFGFLGSRILGQFDPFYSPNGRLLLVAPNIVQVERQLSADPSDFRLWVCLHEETHRVQFTAVPWMRDHVFSEMSALLASVETKSVFEDGLRRISDSVRGQGGSLVEMMSTPEQAAILDRLTGVMSLLEGHADVVMDGVGPSVIGSVDSIRAKFTQRRKGTGSLDRWVRRLLGLEAKMAQYRDGAKFVREVVDKVGMTDFNAVWASAENLPSKAEIHDPAAWITRIHQ